MGLKIQNKAMQVVFYCIIKSELSEITPATARGRVGWGRGRGGQHAE